jgi:hypothetical protein
VDLKPGTRLRSTADETEVVVVKAAAGDVDLRCGGHPMVPLDAAGAPAGGVEAGFDEGTLLGKRYTDEDGGLEVLCTKGGSASLSIGDRLLVVKGAKPLPSSD